MNSLKLVTGFALMMCIFAAQAQTLTLNIPHETVGEGDTVELEVTASDFVDIVSMQFSINWDPTVIQYESNFETDLEGVAVGEVTADEGNLRISWFDVDAVGVDLADGTSVLGLRFSAIGNAGDSTVVEMTEEPLEIQIFQGDNGVFVPITLNPENGSVTIIPPLSATAEVGPVSCFDGNDGFIDLNVEGDTSLVTFLWTGPDGFTSTDTDIQGIGAGFYELQIFDLEGNIILNDTYIVVGPLAGLVIDNIEADTTDCTSETGGASITVSGGTAPYLYDIGEGAIEESEFSELAAGEYFVTVTDNNACTVVDTFLIQESAAVEFSLGEDVVLCEGNETEIISGEFSTYQWSTGETSSTITVNQTGDYSVTVTNAAGCEATDTLNVLVQDGLELIIENDMLDICPEDSIQLNVSGGTVYQWTDPNASLSALDIANPVASPSETTIYEVIASNDCGVDTVELEVIVNEITATAGQDTCISEDTALQLYATGGVEYFWYETPYPVSTPDIGRPTVAPLESTVYVVDIVDANGCMVTDSILVAVATDPEQFIKSINMITPNGDGKNDVLEFDAINKYPNNSLRVFNRWGDQVYQKVSYGSDSERFDGTYKGKPLPAGNYYYVLSFKEYELKQTLTIIRN